MNDGEQRHWASPATFAIPADEARHHLDCGDHTKLIVRIALDGPADPVACERMWVLVRERVGPFYVGMLHNHPAAISPNDALGVGTELPFRPEHVIDAAPATPASRALADFPPRQLWRRG